MYEVYMGVHQMYEVYIGVDQMYEVYMGVHNEVSEWDRKSAVR